MRTSLLQRALQGLKICSDALGHLATTPLGSDVRLCAQCYHRVGSDKIDEAYLWERLEPYLGYLVEDEQVSATICQHAPHCAQQPCFVLPAPHAGASPGQQGR